MGASDVYVRVAVEERSGAGERHSLCAGDAEDVHGRNGVVFLAALRANFHFSMFNDELRTSFTN